MCVCVCGCPDAGGGTDALCGVSGALGAVSYSAPARTGLKKTEAVRGTIHLASLPCFSIEIIAKPSRDEARPSHNCANITRGLHFGRDGLCPVHFREGFASIGTVKLPDRAPRGSIHWDNLKNVQMWKWPTPKTNVKWVFPQFRNCTISQFPQVEVDCSADSYYPFESFSRPRVPYFSHPQGGTRRSGSFPNGSCRVFRVARSLEMAPSAIRHPASFQALSKESRNPFVNQKEKVNE